MTVEKGLDEVPSEGEALRLLEERRRVHIPDESKRVIPPKKKEAEKKKEEKKERKRKRDSSSNAESATRRATVETIRTTVPI